MLYCLLCEGIAEGNLDKDCEAVVCWRCFHKWTNTSQEKFKEVYREYVEKGFKEKAEFIATCITEKEVINEPKQHTSDLERKRAGRKVRTAHKSRDRQK